MVHACRELLSHLVVLAKAETMYKCLSQSSFWEPFGPEQPLECVCPRNAFGNHLPRIMFGKCLPQKRSWTPFAPEKCLESVCPSAHEFCYFNV